MIKNSWRINIIWVILLMSSGCEFGSIPSTHLVGEKPLDIRKDAKSWAGDWLLYNFHQKPGEEQIGKATIKIQDAKNGVISMVIAQNDAEKNLENLTIYLKEINGRVIWNYQESTNKYQWGLISKNGPIIAWQYPDNIKVEELIKNGALPGVNVTNVYPNILSFNSKNSLTNVSVIIGKIEKKHFDSIVSEKNNVFVQDIERVIFMVKQLGFIEKIRENSLRRGVNKK